jgi:hypothetical protein
MLALEIPSVRWAAGETGDALRLIAPLIAGQALLDLFLAATRWKHRMRYEVLARSVVEPYAALVATAAAWAAGFEQTGLLIGYGAGTLCALGYALTGARRCLGRLDLRQYRPLPARLRAVLACRRSAIAPARCSRGGTSISSACSSARRRPESTTSRARCARRSARSARASTGC